MRTAVVLGILLLAGPGQDNRAAVPSDDAQARAEKVIREIFKNEYASKTPAAQQKLAQQLVQQGLETTDDPAARYVLYREAADFAARSGDVDTLMKATDLLTAGYRVDRAAVTESFLSKAEVASMKPEDLKRLVESLLELSGQAVEADQFDVAARAAQSALAAAKKAKDIALTVRADAAAKSLAELRSGYDKARTAEQALIANAGDPQANQAWGEYLCFGKGQWEKGLPHLAKGPDSPLKSLAAKELLGPTETAARMEIADGWWDLGQKEKNTVWKGRLLAHAVTIYDAVLPETSGLSRMKLEKRIADASAAGARVPRVNRNGLVVWWRCDDGKGSTLSNSAGPGNVATLMNGVEWVPGRLGKAVKLDGKTGYIQCAAEKFPPTNGVQTISFWFHLYALPTRGEDFFCFSNDPISGAVQAGVGKQFLSVWRLNGMGMARTATPAANVWHHFAYVYDGKTHSLYVDGKLENTGGAPPQAVPVTNCEFGRWRGGRGANYFTGALDEIRVYNRTLTEAEIRGLATGNE
jgi:hypothetical protein